MGDIIREKNLLSHDSLYTMVHLYRKELRMELEEKKKNGGGIYKLV